MKKHPATKLIVSAILAASIIWPSSSMAQCNSYCTVGAAGTGGDSSGGAAQGCFYIVPGHVEGLNRYE